jgi:hypothetical protein
MVSNRKNRDRFPKLTRHKASGQGVVRLDGKDIRLAIRPLSD